MTVRDFVMLALILVVGLAFNRCAFEGRPVFENEHGASHMSSQTDESLEEPFDRIDRQLDEFGEAIERKSEELERRLERTIGRAEDDNSARSSVTITKRLRDGSDLHLVLPSACEQTILDWGEMEKPRWSISLSGDEELDAPDISYDKAKGSTTIAYGERTPVTVKLALPSVPFRLTIKEPDFIDAELLPGELAVRLGRIGDVNAVRQGDRLTLSGDGWSLVLNGIKLPVRIVDSVGRVLGEFAADAEARLMTGEKGGTQ